MIENIRGKFWDRFRSVVALIICVMCYTGFVFAQDDNNLMPKLAFTINNNEVMLFNESSAELSFGRVVVSPVKVNGRIYVPARAFSEMLGYSLVSNDVNKAITITRNEKTVEYIDISIVDDLQKENRYFSLEGVSYICMEEFALLEDLQIAENKGTYLFYKKVSEDEYKYEYKTNINNDLFYIQDDQLFTTERLVQILSTGIGLGNEDKIESVKVAYNGAYYKPFINPYVPYSYTQMITDIDKLKVQYPEYIKTSSAGKSVEGRDLITMEFGNGQKHIYLFGSHHAREYISTAYIMKFVNEAAYAAKAGINNTGYDVNNILNNVTYHIIPMVNPDGVNLVQNGIDSVSPEYKEQVKTMPFYGGAQYGYKTWKSNIRGVDINRNYPTAWEKIKNIKNPSSSSYPGPYPASEPETQAVMNYLTLYKPEMVVSMHTQGQVIYWSSPDDNLGDVGRKMLKVSGFGPIAENRNKQDGGYLSNYIMSTYNAYEVTIELCKHIGPYPYPDAEFDQVWAPSKDLLLIIGDEIAKKNISPLG